MNIETPVPASVSIQPFDSRAQQIAALEHAVAAADRGEFASADEVELFFKAYGI